MARLLFAVKRGSGHTKPETVIQDAETTPRMEEEKKFGPITEELTFPLFVKTSARGTTEGHREQGRIHGPRCALVLHYATFSDFHESVTDGSTDERTD